MILFSSLHPTPFDPTGKWFNYGILFIVILLDLNMWKNQIFYTPYQYGQYVDEFGRIYSVMDQYSLDNGNSSTLTFEYRNATVNPDTGERWVLCLFMIQTVWRSWCYDFFVYEFPPAANPGRVYLVYSPGLASGLSFSNILLFPCWLYGQSLCFAKNI